MAAQKDYYKILGVSKTATADEIRKAYKQLARKHHPDLNPKSKTESEKKFKEIAEAHAILVDPEKRKRYDEFGAAGVQEGFDPSRARQWQDWSKRGGFTTGGPGGGGFEFHFGGPGGGASFENLFRGGGGGGGGATADMGDILEGMFGGGSPAGRARRRGGGARRGPPAGEDIEHEIEIGVPESLRGTTVALELDRGNGPERIDAKIPAGVREGQRVRLAGLGAAGGDLYVRVKLRPHPFLERRGDDVVIDVPVTVAEAVAGAKVDVPLPQGGTVEVKIPPGTSSGRLLRLRGLGAPKRGGGKGDLLVRVQVAVPSDGGAAAAEAAHALDQFYGKDLRSGLKL